MTIKELCNKTSCNVCPFCDVCWDLCQDPITELDDEHITHYTNAIIETARILQEDKNGEENDL